MNTATNTAELAEYNLKVIAADFSYVRNHADAGKLILANPYDSFSAYDFKRMSFIKQKIVGDATSHLGFEIELFFIQGDAVHRLDPEDPKLLGMCVLVVGSGFALHNGIWRMGEVKAEQYRLEEGDDFRSWKQGRKVTLRVSPPITQEQMDTTIVAARLMDAPEPETSLFYMYKHVQTQRG